MRFLIACGLFLLVFLVFQTVTPRKLTLWLARRTHLARLHEYALAGKFPKNEDFPDRREAYFIDRHGTACAVASLMIRSGREPEARTIAAVDNHVRVMSVTTGPLIDWIAESGLLREECALIQPTYEWKRYEPYPRALIAAVKASAGAGLPGGDADAERERTRIREHLLAVEAKLRADTWEAIRVAAWRGRRGAAAEIDRWNDTTFSMQMKIGFDVRGRPARSGVRVPVTVQLGEYGEPRVGDLEVVARDAQGRIRARETVKNRAVRPDGRNALHVRVALPCAPGTARVEAAFVPAAGDRTPIRCLERFVEAPAAARVAVLIGSENWVHGGPGFVQERWFDQIGDGWQMCHAAPEMLPDDARAYAGVEAIVLGRRAHTSRISDAQCRAIAEHVRAGGTFLAEGAADFTHINWLDDSRLMPLLPAWAARETLGEDFRQRLFPARPGARAIAPPGSKDAPLAYEMSFGAGRTALGSTELGRSRAMPVEKQLELLLRPPADWRRPDDGASASREVRAELITQMHAARDGFPDGLRTVYEKLSPEERRAFAQLLVECDAAVGLSVAEVDASLRSPDWRRDLPPVPLARLALDERELELPARAGHSSRRALLEADRADPAAWRAELERTPALAPGVPRDQELALLAPGDEVPDRETRLTRWRPLIGHKIVIEPDEDLLIHGHASVNSKRLASALNAACAGASVDVRAGGIERTTETPAALFAALEAAGYDVALVDARSFVSPLECSHVDDHDPDRVVVPVRGDTGIALPGGEPLVVPAFRSEHVIVLFRRGCAWPEALARFDGAHPARFRPALEARGRWPRLRVVAVRPRSDAVALVELARTRMRAARFLELRYGFSSRELGRILGDPSTLLDGRVSVFPCIRDPRFDFYLGVSAPPCSKPDLTLLRENLPETEATLEALRR
jgi:hypothetical protein